MIINWSLCICDHHNQVFLQIAWQFQPIGIEYAIGHIFIAFRSQFPEETIDEQIRSANHCVSHKNYSTEINMLELLRWEKIFKLSIFNRENFLSNILWRNYCYQVQLKNDESQNQHAEYQLNENQWTIDTGRFQEPTGNFRFNS